MEKEINEYRKFVSTFLVRDRSRDFSSVWIICNDLVEFIMYNIQWKHIFYFYY